MARITRQLNNAKHETRRRRVYRFTAFTLVELLIVIALTGLLLGLLFGPLVQGFRLTRRASALVQAQDASRFGLERLTRELRQASYVFDNTITPIRLPLEEPSGNRANRYGIVYPNNFAGNPSATPDVLFGRIDFVSSALQPGANQIDDPTTGRPFGGADVRLPLAPGTRIVRYFVGLRTNLNPDGTPAYYRNVYEFPKSDDDLNPFILYRVEFDPNDPNFVVQDTNKYTANAGGINDPNFFYNVTATPNGQTYAKNWRDAADPVLNTTNLDLLQWRRDSTGRLVDGSPIQLGLQLTPSAVVGDTATPGFIGSTNNESPDAVPTLYTTQFGQWVLPYTITVYRGAANQNSGPVGKFGILRLQVRLDETTGATVVGIDEENSSGSLAATQGNTYIMQSVSSGKYFVSTPNLTFQIDPSRGRLETGLPPITGASANGGAPYYIPAGTATPVLMNPGIVNFGELLPIIFRQNTRNDDPATGAGVAVNAPTGAFTVPQNQGILSVNLAEPNYYVYAPPLAPLPTGSTGAYLSPFAVFGASTGTNVFRGAMLAAGTEQVMGPDNFLNVDATTPGIPPVVSYTRIVNLAGTVARKSTKDATGTLYIQTSPLRYRVEEDLNRQNNPEVIFDQPGTTADTAPGLPARPRNDTGNPERDVRITYLWQNNYARNAAGDPINANGISEGTVQAGDVVISAKPEPDVFKVDYATRAQINVSLGVRVYDTQSRRPQVAQVSDKVKVNNVAR